ncbi:MAG: hypothetical protein ACFCBW_03715 [Candidatus Competibacterales bacterium]
MAQPSATERPLLEALHHLVFTQAVFRELIGEGFARAQRRLDAADFDRVYISYPLPIAPFHRALPAELATQVGLCRLFVLKAGQQPPHPEIHRNSTQRLVAYRGSGAICSAKPGGIDRHFQACAIAAPTEGKGQGLEHHWDVVSPNTWHYPRADGGADWWTVTFHSATAENIVDEYDLTAHT